MCKIRVVIDTSTLRSDSRLSSGPMEALTRFAEKGHVEIFIPYVVAGEFTTKPSSKIESLADLRKTLKNLRQNVPNELHQTISQFETCIAQEFDKIEASAKERFGQWQTRTRAKIGYPGPDHANRVLQKYFAGSPPFAMVKARADIPDAFIVETMLDLAAEGPVLAVTKDVGVGVATKNIPNITAFASIKELLESEVFGDALADLGVDAETEYEKANIERIVAAFLRDQEHFRGTLDDDIAGLVSGRTITYRNPHYDEKEGTDELYIESVESVLEWTIDGTNDYLGEGVILVNFEALVEVSVDDPMSGPYHDEDGNVDSGREVRVSGAISLSLDRVDLLQIPTQSSTEQLLKSASVSIDELDEVTLVARRY